MRHLMTSTYYFYSDGNGIQTEMNETEIVHKLNRHSLSHLFYHECYRKWNLEGIVWFLVIVDIVSQYLVLFSERFLSLNIHHVIFVKL